MIDCGPHALNSLSVCGVSLYDITDIIITHSHCDHLCIESVNKIAACGGVRLWLRDGNNLNGCDAQIIYMNLFESYNIDNLTVIGVPANHDQSAFPQHLLISDGDKKLFYALDGAWILNETVSFIKELKLNTIVLDATVGDYNGDYRLGEHNSIPMIRLMIDSMRTLEIINENTNIILSHIACCLHKPHIETQLILDKDNLVAAYDGLEINV